MPLAGKRMLKLRLNAPRKELDARMSFGSYCQPLFSRWLRACLRTALVFVLIPAALQAENVELGATSELSLQSGLRLEQARRWHECVRYYEQATRKWPEDRVLEQRLLVCRVHADVERRYLDNSFVKTVDELTTDRALDLYAEVLTQLESDYVHQPNWATLQRHGTAFLEVALTEPLFMKKHLPSANPNAVEEFRLHVHEYIASRPTNTRFDLRANAAFVAGLAKQHLGLSSTATVMEYACGAIGLLDPYTRFLTRQQLEETLSNIEGNFVGLGVELKCEPKSLRIVSVIKGGPASEAGMQAGDRIVAVNQAYVGEHAPETVADMLRGPEGSWLSIIINRGTDESQTLSLQRRRVDVPCIENVHMADPTAGIGYLRLTTFQKTTISDLDHALWDLHRQGMKSLILDLRGNPGGLLQAAVDAADRFIADGKIVSTKGRKPSENFEYQAHRPGTWSIPLIVLIDRDSASASEIFAGAIRDHQRGHIVGETSYGKGSVQGIFRMQSSFAGLCITTAKFYSPSGREINRHGVQPDEEVVVPESVPEATQLASANPDPQSVVSLKPATTPADVVYDRAVVIARQGAARAATLDFASRSR